MAVTFETFSPCDPRDPKMVGSAIKLAATYSGRTTFDAKQAKRLNGELRAGRWKLADESVWEGYGGERTWATFCEHVLGVSVSWADFLVDEVEPGVGYSQAKRQHAHAVLLAEKAEPLAGPGAPKGNTNAAKPVERVEPLAEHGRDEQNKGSEPTFVSGDTQERGADYLTRRIARDRPDVLERMKAGEFRSVRQAALEAGILKPRASIPRDVDGAAKALRRMFSADEFVTVVRRMFSADELAYLAAVITGRDHPHRRAEA